MSEPLPNHERELDACRRELARAREEARATGALLTLVRDAGSNPDQALQRILETAVELTHASDAGLFVLSGEQLMRSLAAVGAVGTASAGFRMQVTRGTVNGRALL